MISAYSRQQKKGGYWGVPEDYTLNRISSRLLVDYLSQTGVTRIGYIRLQVLSFDTTNKYFVERN